MSVYTRGLPDFVGFFANNDDDDDLRNESQYGLGFAAVWTSHTSVAESLLLVVDDGVVDERYLHAFIGDVRLGVSKRLKE